MKHTRTNRRYRSTALALTACVFILGATEARAGKLADGRRSGALTQLDAPASAPGTCTLRVAPVRRLLTDSSLSMRSAKPANALQARDHPPPAGLTTKRVFGATNAKRARQNVTATLSGTVNLADAAPTIQLNVQLQLTW